MKSGEQLTIQQREEIQDFIIGAILRGETRRAILKYICEKYCISIQSFQHHCKKAKEEIRLMAEENKEAQFALSKTIMRFEDLYKRNLKANNYPECRNVLSQMVNTLGLGQAQKIEITGKDGGAIETKNKTTIDYTKIPDEALLAIVNASK